MTYTLTQADIDSITDLDVAFSTVKNLPAWEDIPEDFKRGNNYTKLMDAVFAGVEPPEFSMKFNDGFESSEEGNDKLRRWTTAHLKSFAPQHQHKIAGVAYALSHILTILPNQDDAHQA